MLQYYWSLTFSHFESLKDYAYIIKCLVLIFGIKLFEKLILYIYLKKGNGCSLNLILKFTVKAGDLITIHNQEPIKQVALLSDGFLTKLNI